MTWCYHTAERMQWANWSRKRRRKFKKRYFRQHGVRFRWYSGEFRFACKLPDVLPSVVLFVREPDEEQIGLGASIRR